MQLHIVQFVCVITFQYSDSDVMRQDPQKFVFHCGHCSEEKEGSHHTLAYYRGLSACAIQPAPVSNFQQPRYGSYAFRLSRKAFRASAEDDIGTHAT